MLCLAPVLRQIWCKKEIFEKITIDNQQVTDGGRVLLNPASATNNDITSSLATSYVVFFVLGCDKSATKILYFCKLYCKRLKS